MFASDPYVADESPFASAEEAALADAQNLSPPPTITTQYGVDGTGRSYVDVTASYLYRSITQFPLIPSETMLTRSVRMYQAAIIPDSG
jgi:hypothetical protein